MKKILSFIIVVMILAFQAVAQDSNPNTSSQSIKLEIAQYGNYTTGRHRAPMHVSVEAYYNVESNSIDVSYDGDATGEVYLYLNGYIIECTPEINTSLQIPSIHGFYRIEIVSDIWIAQGYIQI